MGLIDTRDFRHRMIALATGALGAGLLIGEIVGGFMVRNDALRERAVDQAQAEAAAGVERTHQRIIRDEHIERCAEREEIAIVILRQDGRDIEECAGGPGSKPPPELARKHRVIE